MPGSRACVRLLSVTRAEPDAAGALESTSDGLDVTSGSEGGLSTAQPIPIASSPMARVAKAATRMLGTSGDAGAFREARFCSLRHRAQSPSGPVASPCAAQDGRFEGRTPSAGSGSGAAVSAGATTSGARGARRLRSAKSPSASAETPSATAAQALEPWPIAGRPEEPLLHASRRG